MQDLSRIQSGHVSIGVVAATEMKRRQIIDALNLRKMSEVHGFASFTDLLQAIDHGLVQWVICTIQDPAGTNLANFLKQLQEKPSRQQSVCVSAILKMQDLHHIPELMNLGLMSWHENSDAPEEIAQAIYVMQKSMEQQKNPAVLAFSFLRQYLIKEARWDQIAEYAERLLNFFPAEHSLSLHQIEAYAKTGKQDQARLLLEQMDFYDAELAPRISQLRSQILGEDENQHKLLAVQFRMRTALIVDPENDSAQMIAAILRELGFRNVYTFANGDQAAQFVARQSFDIAVIEWQCSGLAGPFLIQRIRAEGYHETPILVMSKVLDRADIQLVKDMGVAQVLKRPLKQQQLAMAMAWSIMQCKNPTEASGYERKVQEYLQADQLDKAKNAFTQYQSFDTRDPNKEKYLQAFIYYKEKRFEEAKALLIEATHGSRGDNVQLAALLARCLIQLGDHKAAVLILKRVTSLSPKNIERLCMLSELALQGRDMQMAAESLAQAETLDPDAPRIKESQVKIATVSGQLDRASELIRALPNIEDVVVYMNNLAVGSVKTGDVDEGLRLYQNCLKIIPSTHQDRQAVVAYNLGLALVRVAKLDDAVIYLQRAVALGPSPVLKRAESLHQRVLVARSRGISLNLRTSGAASGDFAAEELDSGSNPGPAAESLAYFLSGILGVQLIDQVA